MLCRHPQPNDREISREARQAGNRLGSWRTRCFVSQQIGALQTHTTDTFLFISHTTNALLFKFRCNIFVGVRIIKEMPGSLASGTPCIFTSCKCSWSTILLVRSLCDCPLHFKFVNNSKQNTEDARTLYALLTGIRTPDCPDRSLIHCID